MAQTVLALHDQLGHVRCKQIKPYKMKTVTSQVRRIIENDQFKSIDDDEDDDDEPEQNENGSRGLMITISIVFALSLLVCVGIGFYYATYEILLHIIRDSNAKAS